MKTGDIDRELNDFLERLAEQSESGQIDIGQLLHACSKRTAQFAQPEKASLEGRLGETLTFCRTARDLSREQLAEQAGVPLSGIQALEEHFVCPPLDTLRKIAIALGFDGLSSLMATLELRTSDFLEADLQTLEDMELLPSP